MMQSAPLLNSERVARFEEMLRFTDRHLELLQLQLQCEEESHAGVESVLNIARIEQRLDRVRARESTSPGCYSRQGVTKCIGRINRPYTNER
jgi:hypothetical protein